MSGPKLGWEDTLGVAVNASASGFIPKLGSVLFAKESRGGGITYPKSGQSQWDFRH